VLGDKTHGSVEWIAFKAVFFFLGATEKGR